MGKKYTKSVKKGLKMPDKPIPGGYKTFQLLDAITMSGNSIRKDIEATARIAVDQGEFYRLLAKFSLELLEIDKSVDGLRKIFE